IAQVSFTGGPKATANFAKLMQKRLIHTGSTLRPRPIDEKAAIARGLRERVWPLVAAGRIKPVIDSTFPLAKAAEAHARMETSAHIGKIVLTVWAASLLAGAPDGSIHAAGTRLTIGNPCAYRQRWLLIVR